MQITKYQFINFLSKFSFHQNKSRKYFFSGFKVPLSKAEMEAALRSAGCFIAGQTDNLVPADRELYKRRDVTATVGSDPLIVGKANF
jgi:hypothetical protein